MNKVKKVYFIGTIFFATFIVQACKDKESLDVIGNITGTVKDFNTNKGLSGVMVDIVSNAKTSFVKQSIETDNDGGYGFNDIEAGNYKASFSRSGYVDNSQDVNVLAGQTVSCDATLQTDPDFDIVNGVLTTYYGKGGNVVIPENAGITSIGNNVFKNNAGMISVVIPQGVTNIGNNAFERCENLVSVNIPNTVTNIGSYAFYFCLKLSSADIPEGVITIEDYAFGSCKALISVTIPNSVTTIGNAYSYCDNLTSVTIGSGVIQIATNAFYGPQLTSIIVDNANQHYMSDDGVLFKKTKTALVKYPSGKQGIYTIPDTVTDIEYAAFSACRKLTAITIPNSVTFIDKSAFYSCTSLVDVTVNWATPLNIPDFYDVFQNVSLNAVTLHVPAGTKTAYQVATVWKYFGTIAEY
jgi:hypothetical protein